MEMSGRQRIEAPRAKVWEALNDPEILKLCIPGCQSLEKTSDDQMRAVAAIKVGPITARFNGQVTLSERDPPNAYRIDGEGQGGAAGFAKGGATVKLSDDGAATLLDYAVTAQVGGKLAQLGGAIIDATAKQMADAFFKKLAQAIAPAPAPAAEPAADPASPASAAPTTAPTAPAAPVASTLATRGDASPTAVIGVCVLVAAAAGFLFGREAERAGGPGVWAGLAMALLLLLVAGCAYALGHRRGERGRTG